MELVLGLAVVLGLIPAAIASGKGRSFFAWWFYGFLLFIVAFIHSLLLRPDRPAIEQRTIEDIGGRKCPFCAEIIKREALVCRYCGRDVAEPG